jgi:hypothetical protein
MPLGKDKGKQPEDSPSTPFESGIPQFPLSKKNLGMDNEEGQRLVAKLITLEKFTMESNFMDWRKQATLFFQVHGLWDAINDPLGVSTDKCRQAYTLLYTSVCREARSFIESASPLDRSPLDAAAAWKALVKQYGNDGPHMANVVANIFQARQGPDETVQQYIDRLRYWQDEYRTVKGQPIPEDILGAHLLKTLRPEHQSKADIVLSGFQTSTSYDTICCQLKNLTFVDMPQQQQQPSPVASHDVAMSAVTGPQYKCRFHKTNNHSWEDCSRNPRNKNKPRFASQQPTRHSVHFATSDDESIAN